MNLEHQFRSGDPAAPVLLLLHGTGGGPDDLLGLAGHLDPAAAVLAPRGPVSEHGMARWFRRLAEGVFDHEDVRRRAHDLAEFILAAQQEYGLSGRRLVAVGFSNGANIAAATALLRPEVLSEAALFAGMCPLPDDPGTDLGNSRVFLANGTADQMAPLDSVDRLDTLLRARGAAVTPFRHPGGHQLTLEAARAAAEWLST
ncbi:MULTISPECIES: alpha/beta hydrolase [unclassified Crossiella]|uniref:alpha/beta hydrolase n=1 Tax=unclassified Crossiella TaxID=2620835 RepID=UPI001FFE944C|nr:MULTISPECIES: dienelactone hydrolase family protein [unclassified Crossiella]MCK2238516.1 dienelactone hydrolase family protein [Crossiella sp. S99.2]MCK2251914.1 dienelactone hydrolase family protein [Crossiella sp. S99.1]